MNWLHRRICRSERWAALAAGTLVPLAVGDGDLGGDVLEIGPGFGATTGPLARRVGRLTALEIDPVLAARLRGSLGERVEVVEGDGTAMPFGDGRFSGAVCLTMLHHIPGAGLRDRMFSEVFRVLAAGGSFVGTDSQPTPRLRLAHLGDTFVPLDPAMLPRRLGAAGFTDVRVSRHGHRVRFSARRPG